MDYIYYMKTASSDAKWFFLFVFTIKKKFFYIFDSIFRFRLLPPCININININIYIYIYFFFYSKQLSFIF